MPPVDKQNRLALDITVKSVKSHFWVSVGLSIIGGDMRCVCRGGGGVILYIVYKEGGSPAIYREEGG